MNKWMTVCFDKSGEQSHLINGYNIMNLGKVSTYYQRDNRFIQDQLFIRNDNEMIVLDGIVLNSAEIKKKYDCSSLLEWLDKKNRPLIAYPFFNELIGPFSGVVYDLNENVLVAFCNQTGDAPVFYYNDDGLFLVANEFNLIIEMLNLCKRRYSFNEKSAHHVMTYGYMIDNNTLVSEIKRLMPGEYLSFFEGSLATYRYYKYTLNDSAMSIEEAIEAVDISFRKAVKRCFDKDIEYGYSSHLVDISGGLDSRMVTWVAKDLGYSNIINISYSQSLSDEYNCAREVSKELNTVFVHRHLDDASFLFDIEEVIKMEYGLAPYFGITGGKQLLELINTDAVGLEHTGQLGDVILGSYTDSDISINTPYKRYSYVLKESTLDSSIANNYNGLEEFLVNTRGFLGILATHLIRRNYTYAVSPFLDIDFINTCLSIPMEFKRRHFLYWKWIESKYPNAGKIQSTRFRPDKHIETLLYRIKGRLCRDIKKIQFSFGLSESPIDSNNMNPIQFWYDTNEVIRNYIKTYYEDNGFVLSNYTNTKEDVTLMMKSENVVDKLLGITVLGFLSVYFQDI